MPRASLSPRPSAPPPPPSESLLVHHIPVARLALFEFLSLTDACRLLATCRQLRQDADNTTQLLQLSPVTSVIFHSSAISHLGCLPSESSYRPVHEASGASAFSVAALWEKKLLPMCYQWHHGRRISLRLEPFVLPLRHSIHSSTDLQSALDSVLKGLGQSFLHAGSAVEQLEWASGEDLKPCVDADTEEEDDALHVLANSDSDDSEWDDSDSDSDDEPDDEESALVGGGWLNRVAAPRCEPRLHAKVYKPLLRLFQSHQFDHTRWVNVPIGSTKLAIDTWRSHLLVGLSPTRHVLGGVLVKARAY